jgi:cobalt-zinc-cadmium efflux system outer membrane protein
MHVSLFIKRFRLVTRLTPVLLVSAALTLHARATDAQSLHPGGVDGVTLRNVFDSIRSNNPTLGAADAHVRVARGGLSSARAWSNPLLAVQNEQMSEQMPGMTATERETMTTAMVPLEPFYQRGPRIERARALVRAGEADVLTQRQRVALEAADVFYDVALAQVNVAATRSLAQWFDTVVTYNRVRVREGVTAEADLIRSELERDHVLNELAMAESELARAEADLQTFIRARPQPTENLVEVDSLPLDLDSTVFARRRLQEPAGAQRPGADASPTVTLFSRSEVEAARQRLIASEAATSTERRMFLRELGMMVGTKTSGGSSSLVTGVSLPFPLFDQNRGNISAARAERDAAKFDLEFEQRRAVADLSGAEKAARILSQRVATFGRGGTGYLARAEDARRIALGAYREGGTTLLQVIDAARAWREARSSYFETLFAQHRAVIRLLVAEGVDVLDAWPVSRRGAGQ